MNKSSVYISVRFYICGTALLEQIKTCPLTKGLLLIRPNTFFLIKNICEWGITVLLKTISPTSFVAILEFPNYKFELINPIGKSFDKYKQKINFVKFILFSGLKCFLIHEKVPTQILCSYLRGWKIIEWGILWL